MNSILNQILNTQKKEEEYKHLYADRSLFKPRSILKYQIEASHQGREPERCRTQYVYKTYTPHNVKYNCFVRLWTDRFNVLGIFFFMFNLRMQHVS